MKTTRNILLVIVLFIGMLLPLIIQAARDKWEDTPYPECPYFKNESQLHRAAKELRSQIKDYIRSQPAQ